MPTDHLQKNQRMRPGVKALIVRNKKVLLIHELVHRDGNPVEIIDFPGGGIDFGEALEDALLREVKEEVGLNIEVKKVVGAWDFVLGDNAHKAPEKSNVHVVCIGYQCEVVGEVNIDVTKNPAQEDIYDARWYTVDQILEDNGKLLGNEGMLKAVENLDI